jgi:hypothetical protein
MASGGKEKRRRGKIKVASQHRVPPCDMARTEREELTVLQTFFLFGRTRTTDLSTWLSRSLQNQRGNGNFIESVILKKK